MAFLAIDPGKTGAIAAFNGGKLESIFLADAATLRDILLCGPLAPVVIEQVNGVPGQSAPAAFNFGCGYGQLLGVCAAFAIEPSLVPAMVWKGFHGLRRGNQSPSQFKAQSRALAAKLYSDHAHLFSRAKDDGAAEAALIGHWYLHGRKA